MLSKQHKLTAILMPSFLLAFYPSQAEVISLPLATALTPSSLITVPTQGMTEAQVLDTFGPAISITPPLDNQRFHSGYSLNSLSTLSLERCFIVS